MRLRQTLTALLVILASANVTGCSVFRTPPQPVEVVRIEIPAPRYNPQRPPTIPTIPNDGEFYKAVNFQVVAQAVMESIRASYPDDEDYFDQEDLSIILNAATAWMGDVLPGAFMCLER